MMVVSKGENQGIFLNRLRGFFWVVGENFSLIIIFIVKVVVVMFIVWYGHLSLQQKCYFRFIVSQLLVKNLD